MDELLSEIAKIIGPKLGEARFETLILASLLIIGFREWLKQKKGEPLPQGEGHGSHETRLGLLEYRVGQLEKRMEKEFDE